ncbi:endonuclease domain-containing protein [Sphingomonas parva]|uniref:Endonuclease domain-containing protein n=1 Tax=Sphingomonas parva TaxID=2555898 RepID=A0A4Y8ZSS1_9SPHN|nr:DUF559 domain-containing protein [Sphingomonas parva]TFI57839.1 endonuclease domain-containing protein [Sphingomonas parva]
MDDRLSQTDFARTLRRNASDAERALWRILGKLRPRFTRQYPLGPYVADFACRRARIVVEVDGGQHAENRYDSRRTTNLVASGWRVLRYWNNDVLADADGVVADIIARGDPRLPPGEQFRFVGSRPSRRRREEEEGPPPAPPARAGGEKE